MDLRSIASRPLGPLQKDESRRTEKFVYAREVGLAESIEGLTHERCVSLNCLAQNVLLLCQRRPVLGNRKRTHQAIIRGKTTTAAAFEFFPAAAWARLVPAYLHCLILGFTAEYNKSVRKFTATYVNPIARMHPCTR